MSILTSPVRGFLGTLKHKPGYAALAAFFLESTMIFLSIQKGRILQKIENRDRISLALTNYSIDNNFN